MKRLESWLGSWEAEVDLSLRQLLAAWAVNLSTSIPLFAGGWAILSLTPAPKGVAIAALLGFAVAYGVAVYPLYRYFLQASRRA